MEHDDIYGLTPLLLPPRKIRNQNDYLRTYTALNTIYEEIGSRSSTISNFSSSSIYEDTNVKEHHPDQEKKNISVNKEPDKDFSQTPKSFFFSIKSLFQCYGNKNHNI